MIDDMKYMNINGKSYNVFCKNNTTKAQLRIYNLKCQGNYWK